MYLVQLRSIFQRRSSINQHFQHLFQNTIFCQKLEWKMGITTKTWSSVIIQHWSYPGTLHLVKDASIYHLCVSEVPASWQHKNTLLQCPREWRITVLGVLRERGCLLSLHSVSIIKKLMLLIAELSVQGSKQAYYLASSASLLLSLPSVLSNLEMIL